MKEIQDVAQAIIDAEEDVTKVEPLASRLNALNNAVYVQRTAAAVATKTLVDAESALKAASAK